MKFVRQGYYQKGVFCWILGRVLKTGQINLNVAEEVLVLYALTHRTGGRDKEYNFLLISADFPFMILFKLY
jgi:hypothetical protein